MHISRLKKIPGTEGVKPKVAFYIFPKIDVKRYNITNNERFVLYFLKLKKVLCINGTGFNWNKQDHFRVVYLANCDKLKLATDLLKSFLEQYSQAIC